MGRDQYLTADATAEDHELAIVDFAAWCSASQGNQAGTIASKISAVQYFHRLEYRLELMTQSPTVKNALKGIARAHADAGTARRVRHPVSWDMLLKGEQRISSGGAGGRVLWLCLALSFLFYSPF